jgi:hypothetical protein
MLQPTIMFSKDDVKDLQANQRCKTTYKQQTVNMQ